MREWTVPGYTESRELGSGASGRVVLAVHDATGIPVAVKYLSDELRGDSRLLVEFRAEARLLGDLDSPHVVGLYEYVEAPQGAAIVMELVDGIALRALLQQEGATSPEAALVVLKGSLLGLAAAHRAGLVHRDYKPANVLVARDGSSKLVDFGIAVRSGTTPAAAGTPAYMAPEQWHGHAASPATDVYAATATFYECLTGEKPYPGENFAELAVQHLSAPIPDERAPEPVRGLIRRGLAKDPEHRPQDAQTFVQELELAAGAAYGQDWEERGQRKLAALAALLPLLFPSAGDAPAGTIDLATTALPDQGGRRRPRTPELLAGASAVVLAGVLTFAAMATGDDGGRSVAKAVATTSAVPGLTSGPTAHPSAENSGGATASPSGSPSGSPTDGSTPSESTGPSGSTEPSASMQPSGPGSGADSPTAPGSPTAEPGTSGSASPASSDPPAAPVKVTSVSVGSLRQASTTGATATVDVTTSGTGPVTLTVSWYASDSKGQMGTQDGAQQTFQLSGSQAYTITAEHSFQSRACYWGAVAATSPAAANGSSSQQILTWRCDLR